MQKFLLFNYSFCTYVLVGLLFITVALPLTAQKQQGHTISPKNLEYPIDKKLVMGELDNKLRYFVYPNKNPSDTVVIMLTVNVGSVYEKEHEQGMAHFLEHVAFNGTKNFPGSTIVDFMQEVVGLDISNHLNASTSFYTTTYYLQLPTDDRDVLLTGLEIIRDWLFYVSFEKEGIEKERGIVLSELRQRLGYNDDYFNTMVSQVYKESLLPKRFPIGKEEWIKKFSKKDFENFYKRWYHPENAAISIVGDIEVDKIEPLIKQIFSVKVKQKFKPTSKSIFDTPIISRVPKVYSLQSEEVGESHIEILFKIPPLSPPVSMQEMRTYFLLLLGLTIVNKRLERLDLLAENPLINAYMSSSSEHNRNAEAVSFNAGFLEDKEEEGIERFAYEISRIYKYGFTQEEIESAKESFISKFYVEEGVEESVESFSIIGAITNVIVANDLLAFIDEHWLSNNIRDIITPITNDQLQHMFSMIFEKEDVVILYSEKEKRIDENTVLNILYRGVEAGINSKPLQEDVVQKDIQFNPLLSVSSKEDAIVSEEYFKEADVQKWELKNGITVYSKHTTIDSNDIYFMAKKKLGNIYSSLEENEIAFNLGQVANWSGLANFDMIEKNIYQNRLHMYYEYWVERRALKIYGNSKTYNFEKVLQLLYEIMIYPQYDQTAINKWKINKKDKLSQSPSPQVVYSGRKNRIMANYDHFSLPMQQSAVDSVTQEKLLALHKKLYSSFKGWNFIFVGNLDRVDFKDIIITYLANLPYDPSEQIQKPKPKRVYFKGFRDIELEFESVKESTTEVEFAASIDKDMFLFDKILLANTLKILLYTRINDSIRETLGLSYSPSAYAYYDNSSNRVIVGASVTHEKANRQRILQEGLNIVQDISAGKITLQELENIKQVFYERIRSINNSNEGLMNVLGTEFFAGREHLVEDYILPGKSTQILIESMTIEKIREFAQYIFETGQSLVFATLSNQEE